MKMKVMILTLPLFLQPLTVLADVDLSEAKIVGKWCLTHIDIAGTEKEEMIPYEFMPDGQLTFKNSKNASKIRKASYKIDGDTLELKSIRQKLKIQELTTEKMVGESMAKYHFKKGDC